MKKTLFIIIIVSTTTILSAQTVRPWILQNEDSCYRYANYPIPDESNAITCYLWWLAFEQMKILKIEANAHGEIDLMGNYRVASPTTVFGIATHDTLLHNMCLDLAIRDSSMNIRRLGTIYHNSRYTETRYNWKTHSYSCPLDPIISTHEYYFDHPIHVTDSFYAGIRVFVNQAPYDEYLNYTINAIYGSFYDTTYGPINDTLWCLTNRYDSTCRMIVITRGHFFPIVKLPCQTPERPMLTANVPGLAIFNLGEGDHEALQVTIYNDAGDTVLLSDTTSNTRFVFSAAVAERWYEVRVRSACTYTFSGVDTLAFSHWSDPLRFYYTPDTTAIDPSDLQPPTFDLHPNPTTGILNIELGNLNFEGTATLQLLDLEGRLLQEFQIPNSKFKNPDSKFRIQNSKFKIDITSLPSGTYLLRVVGTTRRVVKK